MSASSQSSSHVNVLRNLDVLNAVISGSDASSAIQALIDANPGREIYLPSSTYHLAARLTVSGEGTVLRGEAMGFLTANRGTIVHMDTPGEPVVVIATGVANGGVSELTVEGCEPWIQPFRHECVLPAGVIEVVNGSEQDGIRIETSFARIHNVMVRNCGRDGVRFCTANGGVPPMSDACQLINVKVQNCRGSGFYFEEGDDSNANWLAGCVANVCMLWGIDDRSFLGNTYSHPFAAECHVLSTAGLQDDDPSHPSNEVTVTGMRIPAGNVSWTRENNLVTLTITDWAYLMRGQYPLQAGHGVVIAGTGAIDGTHLLASAVQDASTTVITFTAPGADVASAQTAGLVRAANPTETIAKAKAILLAEGKITATENLGGDFHRTKPVGSFVMVNPYAESNQPIQVSGNGVILGFAGGGGIDLSYGTPLVLYGKRGSGTLSGIECPTTNVWSQVHDLDAVAQSFCTYGETIDQTHQRYRTSAVDGAYLWRKDDHPDYLRLWKSNPATDASARLLYEWNLNDGHTAINSHGTSAVEINVRYGGSGGESGSGGLKIGNGSGNAKLSLKSSKPDDSEIAEGECCLWFDSSNGASSVNFVGRSTDGTVVSATLPMT